MSGHFESERTNVVPHCRRTCVTRLCHHFPTSTCETVQPSRTEDAGAGHDSHRRAKRFRDIEEEVNTKSDADVMATSKCSLRCPRRGSFCRTSQFWLVGKSIVESDAASEVLFFLRRNSYVLNGSQCDNSLDNVCCSTVSDSDTSNKNRFVLCAHAEKRPTTNIRDVHQSHTKEWCGATRLGRLFLVATDRRRPRLH